MCDLRNAANPGLFDGFNQFCGGKDFWVQLTEAERLSSLLLLLSIVM
jgi:hypothetical protein